MRCINCEWWNEGHSIDDGHCPVLNDDLITEGSNGEQGCIFTKKTIDKMGKEMLEFDGKAFAEECESFNKFMEEEQKNKRE